MPQFYVLKWKGENIELVGNEEVKYLPAAEGGTHVYRNIFPFKVPETLRSRKEELLQLIREAFAAYGYAGRTKGKTVHVQFSKRTIEGE